MKTYPPDAVARTRRLCLQWVTEHADGFPRSWRQEARESAIRGYELYDEFCAPPIAAYEALEAEGRVERAGIVIHEATGEERVHFRLTAKS